MNNQNLEEKINPYESPKILEAAKIEQPEKYNFLTFSLWVTHAAPTFNRKISPPTSNIKQLLIEPLAWGTFLGGGLYLSIAGLVLNDIYGFEKTPYALIPAIIPLTTNLLSGAYELIRNKTTI